MEDDQTYVVTWPDVSVADKGEVTEHGVGVAWYIASCLVVQQQKTMIRWQRRVRKKSGHVRNRNMNQLVDEAGSVSIVMSRIEK